MNNSKYDDIIEIPHPDPKKHPRMTIQSRAAQFSSFAALRGHKEGIEETALENEILKLSREDTSDIDRYFDI